MARDFPTTWRSAQKCPCKSMPRCGRAPWRSPDRCRPATISPAFIGKAGADLYLLKSVIHDWDDERAATILSNVRGVIPDDGRLLIIEPVLPPTVDGAIPATMYLSDLNMLVNVGGRERTRDEFQRLCAAEGFRLDSVTPHPPPASFALLEASPADPG